MVRVSDKLTIASLKLHFFEKALGAAPDLLDWIKPGFRGLLQNWAPRRVKIKRLASGAAAQEDAAGPAAEREDVLGLPGGKDADRWLERDHLVEGAAEESFSKVSWP